MARTFGDDTDGETTDVETDCQLCSSTQLHRILDKGHSPPSDGFLTAKECSEPETLYPLRIVLCGECNLVQLEDPVDPEVLFTDKFVYRTGCNASLQEHFTDLVDELVDHFDLGRNDFVVDIGSNDGTLLSNYPEEVDRLGVDPSRAAEFASERGVPTRQEFFTESVAEEIVAERGEASVVTCTNTFAHVEDLDSLMRGVQELLADDGAFVQESHYLLNLVRKMQHDEIYLEHLRYYSATALRNLFDRFDMDVFHAKQVPTHGGSIRTYAAAEGVHDPDGSVNSLINEEASYGLHDPEVLSAFADQVETNRIKLLNLLTELRANGNTVVGIGAAAKGVSLLNFCRIGPELVDYIAETNDLKIGKYTPGTKIPIVNESQMFEDDPEYALLLAWNIKDMLIPKLRNNGFDGEFIIPNPEVEVIES